MGFGSLLFREIQFRLGNGGKLEENMQHLEDLSLVDLRLVAKKWGIKGVTAYRKQELLEFLKDEQKKRGGDSAEIKEEPAPEVTEEPADSLKEEISASEKEYKGRQMSEKNDLIII